MQYIDDLLIERTIDLSKIMNLKIGLRGRLEVPLLKNFCEKEVIGSATLYPVGVEIKSLLSLDGTKLKEVEGFYPAISGILFMSKQEMGKPSFKITALSLNESKNSDPSIKPLKNISTLIMKCGSLDVKKLEGLNIKEDTIPTYSFSSAQEAKALLEFNSIRAVSAAGAKGAINIWKSTKGRVLRANFCQFLVDKRTIKTVGFSPEMEKFVKHTLKIIEK